MSERSVNVCTALKILARFLANTTICVTCHLLDYRTSISKEILWLHWYSIGPTSLARPQQWTVTSNLQTLGFKPSRLKCSASASIQVEFMTFNINIYILSRLRILYFIEGSFLKTAMKKRFSTWHDQTIFPPHTFTQKWTEQNGTWTRSTWITPATRHKTVTSHDTVTSYYLIHFGIAVNSDKSKEGISPKLNGCIPSFISSLIGITLLSEHTLARCRPIV